MNSLQFEIASSPIGPLFLVASERGLQAIFWKKQAVPLVASLTDRSNPAKNLRTAVTQLQEYFDGKRLTFDLEIDIDGTPFQKSVWRALTQIPYGETISYSTLAKWIRNPKACRAVGSANGKNPLAILVPCHRVIAADQTLGGYAGGLEIKTTLLSLERDVLSSGKNRSIRDRLPSLSLA